MAQGVIQSAHTGNVSLIEVFTDLRVPALPVWLAFYVVPLFPQGCTGGINVKVTVQPPGGGTTWEGRIAVPPLPNPFTFLAAGPAYVEVRSPGDMSIVITVEDEEDYPHIFPVTLASGVTLTAGSGVERNP